LNVVKAPSFIVGLVLVGIGFARADALAQDAPAVPPGAESRTSNAQEASARGLFDEPGKLRKGIQFGARRMGGDETGERTTKSGFYPEMGNMVTGAGWISAGVGYRHWLAGNRAFVDASTGLSWRAYKMAQARFEVMPFDDERISFGTQIRWQDLTQVNYFGEGPDSLEANRSEYRLKSVNTVGYVTVRPREWLAVQGRLGWLAAPELLQPAGAFSRGNPSTVEVFPDDPVYRLSEQPDFLHSEAAVLVETRDVPGYPTRGGVYRIAASRYSDRDANRFTFNRYEAEAAHYIPLVSDNFVLALRGWVAGTTTAPNQHVPFYLAPSLGGSTTLRGFSDYRFHDRNVALLNTELRVAIFEHLDGVAFYDAGNVAARFGDLNLDHTSYGVGVRLHTDTATFARLDLARSVEGWEIVFRMNDPFKLSRWTKRTAHLPFAP
jgi:hypothetical protein